MNNSRLTSLCVLFFFLGLTLVLVDSPTASGTKESSAVERISPEDARQQVQAGKALLVCSYDDDKCGDKMLEGALLRSEFEARLGTLSKDQVLIFYCG